MSGFLFGLGVWLPWCGGHSRTRTVDSLHIFCNKTAGMKVYIHYDEPQDVTLHKTSKLTVPASWGNKTVSEVVEVSASTRFRTVNYGA